MVTLYSGTGKSGNEQGRHENRKMSNPMLLLDYPDAKRLFAMRASALWVREELAALSFSPPGDDYRCSVLAALGKKEHASKSITVKMADLGPELSGTALSGNCTLSMLRDIGIAAAYLPDKLLAEKMLKAMIGLSESDDAALLEATVIFSHAIHLLDEKTAGGYFDLFICNGCITPSIGIAAAKTGRTGIVSFAFDYFVNDVSGLNGSIRSGESSGIVPALESGAVISAGMIAAEAQNLGERFGRNALKIADFLLANFSNEREAMEGAGKIYFSLGAFDSYADCIDRLQNGVSLKDYPLEELSSLFAQSGSINNSLISLKKSGTGVSSETALELALACRRILLEKTAIIGRMDGFTLKQYFEEAKAANDSEFATSIGSCMAFDGKKEG